MVKQEEIDAWDVDPTEQPEEEESDVISYQISYYPADFTLRGYLDKWNDKQLEIPPFQRNYVWDQIKASKLIESFLLGLPVPGVFLYKERRTNKLLVIDGQQRILSAIRFFLNAFDEKIFRLKGVHPKWEGKTYLELPEADQYQLRDAVLRATVVQQLDPEDDTSVYYIFERLNTGGMNLNPMEVRKCVYFGDYVALLEELNTQPHWREILGKSKADKRMRDVELILRVLSLRSHFSQYEKPMKRFLNKHMAETKKLAETELREFLDKTATDFGAVCGYLIAQLGERPFHLRGRLNYAVADSVMTLAFDAVAKGITNFKERFVKLQQDTEYLQCVSANTSDEKTVIIRFLKARNYLVE